MTDWFRTAFGQEYLTLYSHRNQEEAGQLVRLILEKTGLPVGTRVLDAPCGAARHMLAFEAAGYPAYGFDLSIPLLHEARRLLPRQSICRGDLRAIPFKSGSFDLVVNLFSSLGYFSDDETNHKVVCSLVSLCTPGGWLVVDFMNSSYIQQNLVAESMRTTDNSIHVHDRRSISGNPPRVNKETTLTLPDGSTKILNESVRLFTPDELRTQLQRCGLNIEMEFGDYSGAPFTAGSSRIILMGRRR